MIVKKHISKLLLILTFLISGCVNQSLLRGTGDLAVIIERESASILIADTTQQNIITRIDGFGDLSHASVVFSRDARYAYIFGRDGGLTRVDLLTQKIINRIIQSGNSIGGAISQDGKLIAVSNYEPGGVKIFNSKTLELVDDIKATRIGDKNSKVVGLVDAPENSFVFSLWDTGEIWYRDKTGELIKFTKVGKNPYDGLITPNGRYYLAGLFGEDGMVMLDTWQLDQGITRILPGYGKQDKKLPVYKMPHLEGWASTQDNFYVPGIGHHDVLILDKHNFKFINRIKTYGQPVFVMASPTEREIWVNFAHPDNDKIQIIDVSSNQVNKTLNAGKAILHMEFTPRGESVWVSVRDEDRVDIYDTDCDCRVNSLSAKKPSGIFMTSRAHKIGL